MKPIRHWLRALLVVISATAVALAGAVPRAVAQDTEGAHSGDWAVSANLAGGTWNGIYQYVDFVEGVTYDYSVWVRGSGTLAVNIQDGNWTTFYKGTEQETWHSTTLAPTWTNFTGSFVSPETTRGVFRIVDSSMSGAQTFWVDDASLKARGGDELLVNGGFETDGTWEYAPGWSRVENGPAGVANDWAVSAHFTGDGTWGGIEQYPTLPANTAYQYSLRVKGSGKIAVVAQDASWGDLFDTVTGGKVWHIIDLTPEWRTVTGGFTPGGQIGVFRVVDSSDGGDRTFWVDDVSLKGPDGAELLVNGGFEQDEAWAYPEGWARTSLKAGPLGSFTDDDFTAILDKSDLFGIDGSSPEKFGGDADRLMIAVDPSANPAAANPVSAVWQAEVDITHVSLPVFRHTDSPASEIFLAASADGTTWRDLTTQEYLLPNPSQSASEWPLWVTESVDFAPGDRYLKLTVHLRDPKAVNWATQIARLHVNSRVAAVQADPQPGFYDDSVTVTLTNPTRVPGSATGSATTASSRPTPGRSHWVPGRSSRGRPPMATSTASPGASPNLRGRHQDRPLRSDPVGELRQDHHRRPAQGWTRRRRGLLRLAHPAGRPRCLRRPAG